MTSDGLFPRSFGRGLIEAVQTFVTLETSSPSFRDLLVAASLKRVGWEVERLVVGGFRDLLVAASLKPVLWYPSVTPLLYKFPRSFGRGLIEAMIR